jgi:HAD superfamily hydrolase (TIGR01490 family)
LTGIGTSLGIDFFDLDHTLLRGSSGVEFLRVGVRRRLFPPISLVFIPVFYLRYQLGLVNLGAESSSFRTLRGKERSVLEELARETLEVLRAKVYPGARALLAERIAAGRRVVLATSSIEIVVRPLAEELGIRQVIASSFEFRDGRCTGRFKEPPLLKERKKLRVLEYLQRQGVGPEVCTFYTDSISDLPLLEVVGEPVAVNPDLRLRRVARRRGWRILDFEPC